MRKQKSQSLLEVMSQFLLNESLSQKDLGGIVAACKNAKKDIEKVGRGSIPDEEFLQLITASIAIMGRESDFGEGTRYKYHPTRANWIQEFYNDSDFVQWVAQDVTGVMPSGHTASTGPAQFNYGLNVGHKAASPEMKQYAKKIGITGQRDLGNLIKSALMVVGTLAKNYNRAKQLGYSTNEPSVPGGTSAYDFEKWKTTRGIAKFTGTGNAALDMALTGYNTGYGKIKDYRKVYPELKISNYLPCIGDGCTPGSSGTSSLGYVMETGKLMPAFIGKVKSIYNITIPYVPKEGTGVPLRKYMSAKEIQDWIENQNKGNNPKSRKPQSPDVQIPGESELNPIDDPEYFTSGTDPVVKPSTLPPEKSNMGPPKKGGQASKKEKGWSNHPSEMYTSWQSFLSSSKNNSSMYGSKGGTYREWQRWYMKATKDPQAWELIATPQRKYLNNKETIKLLNLLSNPSTPVNESSLSRGELYRRRYGRY